VKTRKGKQ